MVPLGAESWTELVTLAIKIGSDNKLPSTPPLRHLDLFKNPPQLTLDYNNVPLFVDAYGGVNDLPYLGNLLAVTEILPLDETLELNQLFGTANIFTLRNESGIFYLCEFIDGRTKKIFIFTQTGQLLSAKFYSSELTQTSGEYLVFKEGSSLSLFSIGRKELKLIKVFSLAHIARDLQVESPHAIDSSALNCSDFHFQVDENQISIWLFNVGTTAILPGYLHLCLTGDLKPKSTLNIADRFGHATLADRLPLPHKKFNVARIGDLFWVPRQHDPQVDIFDKQGFLVKTCPLEPLPPALEVGPPLSSQGVLADVEHVTDPQAFFNLYNKKPMIQSVYPLGDFLVVTRLNLAHRRYFRFYTILDLNGDEISMPMVGPDFIFMGSGEAEAEAEVLFLFRFDEMPEGFLPVWLTNYAKFDHTTLSSHTGFSLVKAVLPATQFGLADAAPPMD